MITSAKYLKSVVSYNDFPSGYKEFVFCGRSNVGKSSFINSLVNKKNLARTSSTPGKTRTLNLYEINSSILFVDVPGYGYAKVSKSLIFEFGKMIEDYFNNTNNLKAAFLLVDFRHKPTKQDIEMYEFLKFYNIKTYVVATKADKVKNKDFKSQKELIKNTLNLENNLFIVSSFKKSGLDIIHSLLLE